MVLNRLNPGKHKAARLLVANDRTRQALPNPHHPHVETLIENGVDFTRWEAPESNRAPSQPGRLRLVYMGRFVAWKGIDITLRALALAREAGADVSLDLLGDGEERSALDALTHELGVSDHVAFHGFQPQEYCAGVLARSDALVLNSLCECGGAVVLEAMAMGLPVVASAWGGPLDYLNEESGILVDPVPRETFTQRLADAFLTLARDPELRARMGDEGQRAARKEFDWEAKVDRIVEIYREVVANT